jgi:hypothetical protein
MGCVLVELLSALAVLVVLVHLLGLVRSFSLRIKTDLKWPPGR